MAGKKRSALAVYNKLKSEAPREDVQVDSVADAHATRTSTRKPSAKRKSLEKLIVPKEKRQKVERSAKTEVEERTTAPAQKHKPSKQAKKKRATPGKAAKVAADEEESSITPLVEEVEGESCSSDDPLGEEATKHKDGAAPGSVLGASSTGSLPLKSKQPAKGTKKKQAILDKTKKMKAKDVPVEEGEEEGEAGMEEGSQVDSVDELGQGDEFVAESSKVSSIGMEEPFFSQFNPEQFTDSRVAANELFQAMIRPIPVEQFYSEVWEKRPLLVKRHKPCYNDGLFSCQDLQQILVEHYLEFSVNVDITSYKNGERLTHNPAGRASPSDVWNAFKGGCSVRLLNPQTYSKSLWQLNSTLQEHFGSFVGANVYLTPANTQGFAPHYDDIEAFVLQLEGKKQWKLYSPRNDGELLPRYSSSNLRQDEIGAPIMDTVLEPGDLLYFPRGTIHQAMSLPDCHSLHVTLSTFQKNTWGDLLEKLVPAALHSAITEDLELRRGLPTDYLQYMGVVSSDMDDQRRTWFCGKVASMVSKLLQYLPVDAAVDQVATSHINSCLPPCLTAGEKSSGVWSRGPRWEGGEMADGPVLKASTKVKLLRHGVLRMVVEEEGPVIYHSLENTRIYLEKEVAGLAIREVDAPAIEQLLTLYPDPIAIDSLAIEGSTEDKIELCRLLFDHGLLLVVD